MSNTIVINDVPELKNEKTVRAILKLTEVIPSSSWVFDCSTPCVISASQVRKELKKRLEMDVNQEKRGYDLLFLCESGGVILCKKFTDKLSPFSDRIAHLPYSKHNNTDWPAFIEKEAKSLKDRPNVAIIEGDVGKNKATSEKLRDAIAILRKKKPFTRIHLVIGAANTGSLKKYVDTFKTIKLSCGWKTEGHILRLSEVVEEAKSYLDKRNLNLLGPIMAALLTDDEAAALGRLLVSAGLYSPTQKKAKGSV